MDLKQKDLIHNQIAGKIKGTKGFVRSLSYKFPVWTLNFGNKNNKLAIIIVYVN